MLDHVVHRRSNRLLETAKCMTQRKQYTNIRPIKEAYFRSFIDFQGTQMVPEITKDDESSYYTS